MLIRFWGTRGSLPVALTTRALQTKLARAIVAAAGKNLDTEQKARAFIANELEFTVSHTFGGHSPCVQIEAGGDDYVLCDLGSGARPFGNTVLAARSGAPATFHVFMSHVHWDHIMGFPLFTPAYVPGNRIRIYGCHSGLEEAFRRQHAAPSFPVEFNQLAAQIEFITLEPGRRYEVAGLGVQAMLQSHSGDSYGYRFERNGKSVVYSTDSEHKVEDQKLTDAFVAFFRGADLVIFDAMYSLADAVSVKADWGHSSNIVGVELCQMAGARRLCLFHHEPMFSDNRIYKLWRDTRRLEELTRSGSPLEVLAAYDGLEITL
ncbi:MAG: MBL fold metallo-hydrolase [Burkholderiales bacterium]